MKNTLKENSMPKNKDLIKHSAAIHISNTLSATERKISNILLKNAFNCLHIKETHNIPTKEIIHFLGWISNRNHEPIKNALKKLNTTQIEWNILKKDKKHEWGISTIISGVKIKNGMCEYSYSPALRELLAMPNIYARLNMSIQAKLSSKYSLALWEFLTEALCNVDALSATTCWMELHDMKKILGVQCIAYNQFKTLKRDILKKSLTEVNTISDIKVEEMYKKNGRKIVAVAFKASRKLGFNYDSLDISNLEIKDDDRSLQNLSEEKIMIQLTYELGVSPVTAKEILKNYSVAKIEEAIKYVKEQANNKKISNISAYFLSALKDNWNLKLKDTSNINEDLTSRVIDHLQQQQPIWKEILTHLRNWYGDQVYCAWFSQMTFISYSKNTYVIKIEASTDFYADWISNNYSDSILKASRLVVPCVNNLEICGNSTKKHN